MNTSLNNELIMIDNKLTNIIGRFDISSLLFVHSTLISFGEDFKTIRYVCVMCLLLFLFVHHSFRLDNKRNINRMIYLFSISVIVSGIYGDMLWGNNPNHVNCWSSMLLAVQIVISFSYVNYAVSTNKIIVIRNSIFVILLFYLIITDFYICYNYSSIIDDPERIFIIGNKFVVSYLNLLCFALLSSFDNCKLFYKLLLGFTSLFISASVYCSTGIIGNVLMILFVYIANVYKKLLNYSSIILLLFLLAPFLFFTFVNILIEQSFFKEILNALGENENLTGRTVIYASVLDIVAQSPWVGYGNGNAPIIVDDYVGFGNSQNGIIEDVLNWGVISFSLFVVMIFKIICSCKIHRYNSSLFILLLIMIIMSSVEITLGLVFIVYLTLFVLVSKIPYNDYMFK